MDFKPNDFGPRPVPSPSEYEACPSGALPAGQMASVRAIQESFIRGFAAQLAGRLEMPVAGQLAVAQPLSSDAFLQSQAEGECLMALAAEPVRGEALAAFSPGLIAYLLRILLGSPETAEEAPRPVTEIELHILREIFESLESELGAAWQPAGIAFRRRPMGHGAAAMPSGAMLVFEYSLEFGEIHETLRIAVPAFLARLAVLQCAPAAETAPAPLQETILGSLRHANVSAEAVLAGSTIRMGDVLAMQPGHVLMLIQPARSPLELRINGRPKFRGEWVVSGSRPALNLL